MLPPSPPVLPLLPVEGLLAGGEEVVVVVVELIILAKTAKPTVKFEDILLSLVEGV